MELFVFEKYFSLVRVFVLFFHQYNIRIYIWTYLVWIRLTIFKWPLSFLVKVVEEIDWVSPRFLRLFWQELSVILLFGKVDAKISGIPFSKLYIFLSDQRKLELKCYMQVFWDVRTFLIYCCSKQYNWIW